MKQINNGFDKRYYLTEEGEVFDNKKCKYLKLDNRHCIVLFTEEGNKRKISIKNLYFLVYNKIYVKDTIENLENEEWRVIKDTNDMYFISDKGRVKSYKNYEARILKTQKNERGYERVDLVYKDGSRSTKLIGRLVAAAFLNPPEEADMQLHHKNGNNRDNRKENLVWLTPTEHREEHRRMKAAARKEKIENECAKPEEDHN